MITTGLALVSRETRLRLITARGHILDVFKMPDAMSDPEATKLCAALALVTQAIEILQPGDAHQQTGASASAGDSNG